MFLLFFFHSDAPLMNIIKTITVSGYIIDNYSYNQKVKIKSYSVKKAVQNSNYGYRIVSGKKSYVIDSKDEYKIIDYLLKYKTIKIKSRLAIKPIKPFYRTIDKNSIKRNIQSKYFYKLQDSQIKADILKVRPDISGKELKIEKRKKQIILERDQQLEAELEKVGDSPMDIIRKRIEKFDVSEVQFSEVPSDIVIKLPVIDSEKILSEVGTQLFLPVAEDLMNRLPFKYLNKKTRIINKKSKQAVIIFFKKKNIRLYDAELDQSMQKKKYGLYPRKEYNMHGELKLIGYLILENRTKVKKRHLADVHDANDSQMERPELDFQLNDKGGKKTKKPSSNNAVKRLSIVLNRVIVSIVLIQSEVDKRSRKSMGDKPSLDEVKKLLDILEAGVLPETMRYVKPDDNTFYVWIKYIRPFK